MFHSKVSIEESSISRPDCSVRFFETFVFIHSRSAQYCISSLASPWRFDQPSRLVFFALINE